jgi:hypothetical protein
MNNSRVSERKRPIGIFIFGGLFVISSFVQMLAHSFGYVWYREVFNYLPAWLFNIRYCFFLVQYILGISAGIGLLQGNKICRKIVVVIAVFTITTLYWKYDYPSFLNHCQMLDVLYGDIFRARRLWHLSFVRLCTPALMTQCLLEISFLGALLYYLTRPSIKEYFEKSHQSK